MTFGETVAKERKLVGLSQKELATRILKEDGAPISPQYLNDLEHDRRSPPPQNLLQQFARELNIPFEYLLYLARELPHDLPDGKPQQVKAAFQAFRRVLEDDQP
jgi:transcriptional regulator with XRE-family HTH domain